MQHIAELFNGISLGSTIVWVCAIITIGKTFNNILEKYHMHKKSAEKEDEVIEEHTKSIEELSVKMDSLIETVNTMSDNYDKSESKRMRREILKFSDSLRDGRTPSRESFKDIFDYNVAYEDLIESKGIKNGFTAQEMKFIESCYQDLYGSITDDN